MTTPLERFEMFHHANPHVYEKLVEIAFEAHSRGRRHWGIAALFERLRWISQFETTGDPYKLNNDYRAFYARQLMKDHPQFRGLFQVRDSAVDELIWSE